MFHSNPPSYIPIYQSHPGNPSPSSAFYPQSSISHALHADSSHHLPPGVDPSAQSYAYPPAHPAIEAEAAAAALAAAQGGHGSSVENSSVPTTLNYPWNNNPMTQPSALNALTVPNQLKFIQPVRCEVCNIDCNSKDVYEKHCMGKKHKRKLQTYSLPTTALNSSVAGSLNAVGGGAGTIGVAAGEDIGTKKHKLLSAGTSTDSMTMCSVCNIVCNSQEVLNKHLYGKKHAIQAGIMLANTTQPFVAASVNPNSGIATAVHSLRRTIQEKMAKKTKLVQSAWCDVCKLHCNSQDIYRQHILGKKHQKNLEKLEKQRQETGPAIVATNPVIGPVENPAASQCQASNTGSLVKSAGRSRPPEDLESKKRKVMENGTAAGAVKVCDVCTVVCTSDESFNSHLFGQKHAAKLKQAEAGAVSRGRQLIASA